MHTTKITSLEKSSNLELKETKVAYPPAPTLTMLASLELFTQLGSTEKVEELIRNESKLNESLYSDIQNILNEINKLHQFVADNKIKKVDDFLNAAPSYLLPVLLKTKGKTRKSAKRYCRRTIVEGTALMMALNVRDGSNENDMVEVLQRHIKKALNDEAKFEIEEQTKEQVRIAADKREKQVTNCKRYTFIAASAVTVVIIAYRFMSDTCKEPTAIWTDSHELEPATSHWMVNIGKEITKPFIAGGCTLWTMAAHQITDYFSSEYAAYQTHFSYCNTGPQNTTTSTIKECEKAIEFAVDQQRSDLLQELSAESLSYTAMHYAAKNGHCYVIRNLLNRGANINHLDHFGMTPLVYAVVYSHHEVVSLLIEKGASLNSPQGHPLLVLAIQPIIAIKHSKVNVEIIKNLAEANPELVKELLANEPDILLQLVRYNNTSILDILLTAGASVASVHSMEELLIAAIDDYCRSYNSKDDHLKTIKVLLSHGAKADRIYSIGTSISPRLWDDENRELASLLLDAGIPINPAFDHSPSSPLEIALFRQQPKVAALLLERGAELPAIGKITRYLHDISFLTLMDEKRRQLLTVVLKTAAHRGSLSTFLDILKQLAHKWCNEIAIATQESGFKKENLVSTLTLLINAGYEVSLSSKMLNVYCSPHVLPESWLMKIVDSLDLLEKLPAQIGEPTPRLKGLIALLKYAVQNNYVSLTERLLKRSDIGVHIEVTKESLALAAGLKHEKIQVLLSNHLRKITTPTYLSRFSVFARNMTQDVTEMIEDFALALTH